MHVGDLAVIETYDYHILWWFSCCSYHWCTDVPTCFSCMWYSALNLYHGKHPLGPVRRCRCCWMGGRTGVGRWNASYFLYLQFQSARSAAQKQKATCLVPEFSHKPCGSSSLCWCSLQCVKVNGDNPPLMGNFIERVFSKMLKARNFGMQMPRARSCGQSWHVLEGQRSTIFLGCQDAWCSSCEGRRNMAQEKGLRSGAHVVIPIFCSSCHMRLLLSPPTWHIHSSTAYKVKKQFSTLYRYDHLKCDNL